MSEQKQPTVEDMAKMQAVATAGGQAASTAETPEEAKRNARQAMREEADRQDLKIPDEELDRIADALGGRIVDMFEQRGAFDPPPEPVQPPAQPTAPAETPGAPAEQAAQEPAPQQPQKRTWAHRFMGV